MYSRLSLATCCAHFGPDIDLLFCISITQETITRNTLTCIQKHANFVAMSAKIYLLRAFHMLIYSFLSHPFAYYPNMYTVPYINGL